MTSPAAPSAADHLGWLADATDRFTAVLAGADLTAAVPACPGWSLAALGEHLGQIHTWARGAIVEGHPNTEPPSGPADLTDPAALAGWYRLQADGLLATLREVDPAAPAWGFGAPPRTAAFWFRRQQHEASMHLCDALASQGAVAGYGGDGAADGALRAADAVDEVATVFLPRQVRMNRIPPLQRSLALQVAGGGPGWLLAGDGTAPPGVWPVAADATLTGPAEALARVLWGRLGLGAALAGGSLLLTGDEQAARSVLAAGITP